MSVTLKTNNLKIKNSDGTFTGFDIIADRTNADMEANLTAAQEAKTSAQTSAANAAASLQKNTLLKGIIAVELSDMTADAALSVNDFRIVGDTLYRVTAGIAAGGTLVAGTNVVATSVAEVLSSLLN